MVIRMPVNRGSPALDNNGVDTAKLADTVGSLQRDMVQVGSLVTRLDVTIEKLTEVSTAVSQLLAVQGNRLEFQEKVAEKLQNILENRRQEHDSQIKDIHAKIDATKSDLQDEIEDSNSDVLVELKSVSDKMSRIEKLVWIMIGAATVIGVFTDKLNLLSLV